MDSVDGESVNQLHSQNDSDASAIRGVMIQKREILKCIEREIAQLTGEVARLVEKKSEIEKDLVRLGGALGHRNRFLLPNEILSRVFVLAVQDYGPVAFPMRKNKPPPQLTISHVCSHWRKVALRTSELWSSTRLTYFKWDRKLNGAISLHQRWLMRARQFPVSLSIDLEEYEEDNEITTTLQRILLPFQVKKLHLVLTQERFMELSSFLENMLSDLTELALDLTIPCGQWMENVASISDTHPLIPRLRSVSFHCDEPLDNSLDRNVHGLPWSQLQAIEFADIIVENPNEIVKILRQIPMLHMLKLGIDGFQGGSLEDVIMPSLQDFELIVEASRYMMDGIEL